MGIKTKVKKAPKYKGAPKPIDQAAIDKKVQERRAANKKRTSEKKAAKAKKPSLWERAKAGYAKESKKQKAASRARLTEKQREHLDAGEKTRAKKKEGKTWTKAAEKQKKAGGKTMNELIKARNAAKASGNKSAYATAQNQINKAYGSKKVHDPGKPKSLPKKKPVVKAKAKKAAPKKDVDTKLTSKEKSKASVNKYGDLSSSEENGSSEERKYAQGGKVESNPFGWPSRDARNGGKG